MTAWVNAMTRGWVSEERLLWAFAVAALFQGGVLVLLWFRLRRGPDAAPALSVFVPPAAAVAEQAYDGPVETLALGPGGWDEAFRRTSSRSELFLLAGGRDSAAPGWAEAAVTAGPTHLLRFSGDAARWEPFPGGLAGLLRLVRVPDHALYFHCDGPPPALPPLAWPGRLSGQARKWGVFAHFFLHCAAFGPLSALPFHAYALFWALRGRGAPTLLTAELVLQAGLAGAAAALVLSRRGDGLRAVKACGERVLRPLVEGYSAFIWRKISPFVPAGSRFLDVGAASGLLAERAARELGVPARAVDVAPWTMGSVAVDWYSGDRIPLGDREADVAVCVTVLHHCDDLPAVLRELRRVTSRLILIEDRGETALERFGHHVWHVGLDVFLQMPYNRDGFAGVEGWRARLAAAGFRIVEVRTVPYHLAYSVLLLIVAD